MITVCEVSREIDFQKNEVISFCMEPFNCMHMCGCVGICKSVGVCQSVSV